MSPVGAIVLLLLVASSAVLSGVYLLVGIPYTLIGGGMMLFAAAWLLRSGLNG